MKKQKGIALLIVLLVVAIVATLGVEMAGRLQLNLQRGINIKDNNQAFWYAMGAEQYAKKSISLLMQNKGNDPVNSTQPWAQENLVFPMPNGGIEAELSDLQACFNLNALKTGQNKNKAQEKQAFFNLLKKDELNIPTLNAETLRDSMMDWLDEDTVLSGNYGAEDPDYESLVHPYLAANNTMASKSELRLVKGVEQEWLKELMQYVCVVPNSTELKINVNTLKPEQALLLSAITGMSVSDAQNAISNIPYNDANDFLTQKEVSRLSLSEDQKKWFVTDPEYFILHVKSRYNNASFSMSSVFQVDQDNTVKTIQREFGGKL